MFLCWAWDHFVRGGTRALVRVKPGKFASPALVRYVLVVRVCVCVCVCVYVF